MLSNKLVQLTIVGAMLTGAGSKSFAQVKIGDNPTTINASAILDVESTNKGFLPPRVPLISSTDVVTIPSPATGLLVFNTQNSGTGTNAVEANRIYFWDGTQWAKASVESTSSDTRACIYGYKYFPINASSPTNSLLTVGNISVRWNYTALGFNQPLQVRFNDQADYSVTIAEQYAVPSQGYGIQSSILDIAQNVWTNIPSLNVNPFGQDWYRCKIVKVQEKAVYRISAQFNNAQAANATTGRSSIPAGCTLIIEKLN